jgi:hypothetical protein
MSLLLLFNQGTVPENLGDITATADASATVGGLATAPISTLVDDFSVDTIGTRWTENDQTGTDVTISGGNLTILAKTYYPRIDSTSYYRLTDSSIILDVFSSPTYVSSNSFEISLRLTDPEGANLGLVIGGSPGPWVLLRVNPTGVSSTDFGGVNAPVGMRFFRITESGGTLTTDYSADGVTWIQHYQMATPFPVDAVQVQLAGGHWNATDSDVSVSFGGINVLPQTISGLLTASAQAHAGTTTALIRSGALAATGTATGAVSGSQAYLRNLTATASTTGSIAPAVATTAALPATASATGTVGLVVTRNTAITSAASASAALAPQIGWMGAFAATGAAATTMSVQLTRNAALTSSGSATTTVATQLARLGVWTAAGAAATSLTALVTPTSALSAGTNASAALSPQFGLFGGWVAGGVASIVDNAQITNTGALTSVTSGSAVISGLRTTSSPLAFTSVASVSNTGVVAGNVSIFATSAATTSLAALFSQPGALTASSVAANVLASPFLNQSGGLSTTGAAGVVIAIQFAQPGQITARGSAGPSISGFMPLAAVLITSASASSAVQNQLSSVGMLTATSFATGTVQSMIGLTGLLASSAVAIASYIRRFTGTVTVDASWTIGGIGFTPPVQLAGSSVITWQATVSGRGIAPRLTVDLVFGRLTTRLTEVGAPVTRQMVVAAPQVHTVEIDRLQTRAQEHERSRSRILVARLED